MGENIGEMEFAKALTLGFKRSNEYEAEAQE